MVNQSQTKQIVLVLLLAGFVGGSYNLLQNFTVLCACMQGETVSQTSTVIDPDKTLTSDGVNT
jgi:hypothetical protein